MTRKFLILAAILFIVPATYAQHLNVSKEVPFFDFDISGSSGSYNGSSYSEVHLGLNMNFTDWLTWRNAAFQRFSSGTTRNLSGIDSSFRFSLIVPMEGVTFILFAGPGYRWADHSDKNALFSEAGVGFQVGRFGAQTGARFMRYDKMQFDSIGLETKQEDLSYFITVTGGAGLSF